VERLARRAGVSPAELIKRALRREDEAQGSEGGSAAAAASDDAPTGKALIMARDWVPSRSRRPTHLNIVGNR
jgi:hypothetical protein